MVNGALIAVIGFLFLIVNYFLYGRYIEKKIKPHDRKKTPAVLNKDKTDFYPANKYFLFGHHFASIAGAGPIIGPILAVSYFGWLFTVLWIILGTVFIGAVHDYLSLMISVRHKARGVSEITEKTLNKKSGKIFALMIWITLMLITTVFSVSAADSIIAQPSSVIPVLAISIIAVFLGLAVYKYKKNPFLFSLIALLIATFFIYVGIKFPVTLPFSENISRIFWITILIMYGSVASLVPIWVFLQPRDYLSSIQLILFLLFGFLAIVIINPTINAPMIIRGNLPLWPILFITVACGAVSGFHSLVASGTTSKQLAKESHGRLIGYGGMIAEGILALFVLLFVSSLAFNDGGINFISSLEKGWIMAFGNGFGNIIAQLKIPLITFSVASLIGVFMINQFILTSLDTSMRLSRFVISENLKNKIFKKRFVCVIITAIPAYILAITNTYVNIWRLFGSANQLIAAIALITISAYFVEHGKKIKFLILPTVFMIATTISALLWGIFNKNGFIFTDNWMLAIISATLVILALIVSWEGFLVLKNRKKFRSKDL